MAGPGKIPNAISEDRLAFATDFIGDERSRSGCFAQEFLFCPEPILCVAPVLATALGPESMC
jgi:hypothetical protein